MADSSPKEAIITSLKNYTRNGAYHLYYQGDKKIVSSKCLNDSIVC